VRCYLAGLGDPPYASELCITIDSVCFFKQQNRLGSLHPRKNRRDFALGDQTALALWELETPAGLPFGNAQVFPVLPWLASISLWSMNNSLIKLGTRAAYGKDAFFGVTPRHLFQHAWFIGKSGTGKSTMAHNIAVQLIEMGCGVGVIDPHGSLVEGIASEISKRRTNEVVWFDPAGNHSVGLNVLAPVPPDERSQVTAEVERMFEHLFDGGWGPQSAMLLRNCVATMLDCPVELNPNLLSLYRLLVDENYRNLTRKFVTNSTVQSFWNTYLDVWDDKKRAEASSPLINKLDALIHSLDMKLVLGQVKPKFDPLSAMDEQQVVLCNLSAGRLGEENTEILGSSLVTAFKIAGFRRD